MPNLLVPPIGILVFSHGGVCKNLITRDDVVMLKKRAARHAEFLLITIYLVAAPPFYLER